MSFSTYGKQSWTNGSGGGTALSATRLAHFEDGVAWASTAYNVLAYGATGDGTTNDTAALQAALDAGAGGTVVFPPGTYSIIGALRVSSNTAIYAYGATVRQDSAGGLLYNFKTGDSNAGYTGRGGITVLGGTWDANAADGTSGVVTGGYDAFYFAHATSITVRDATITNVSTAHGMDLTGCDRVRVVNCNFFGYKDNSPDLSSQFREAIQVDLASSTSNLPLNDNTSERDVLVTGCTVGPSSRLGSFGRFIGSHGTDLVSGTIRHTDIRIIGNRIISTIQEGIRAESWTRAIIADNVIVNPGAAGIAVTSVNSTAVDSIVVTGNVIESSAGPGISVIGLSAAPITELVITGNTTRAATGSAISVTRAPGVRIQGNQTYSSTTGGISVMLSDNAAVAHNTIRSAGAIGIFVGGCAGALVSGNLIDTTGSFGVNLATQSAVTSTDCMVTGNLIRAATTAAVRLSAGATGATISGNQIRKATGSTAIGVSVVDSTVTGAVVVGNDMSGNSYTGAAAITIAAGAGTRTDYAGGTAVPGHNLI